MKRDTILKEAFYFFSSLLGLAFLIELVFPGLFILYFNLSIITIAYLALIILILLYVRQ